MPIQQTVPLSILKSEGPAALSALTMALADTAQSIIRTGQNGRSRH